MENKELISIIVPVYNVESYLPKCLDSLKKQIYPQIEFILVDDGSTDSSGLICDNFCLTDKHFRVIHKANGGVSSARNIGLEAALGSYIGFVDSDDWTDPRMFQSLCDDIKHNQADIAVCSYYKVSPDQQEKITIHKKGLLSSAEALDCLLNGLDSSIWCRLYRREVFHGLYFPEGHTYEDITLMPKLIMNSSRIVFNESAFYYYRIGRIGSIVSTKSPANLMDYFDSYMGILQLMKAEKPEFSKKAVKGVAISYLSQYKILTDFPNVSTDNLSVLNEFKIRIRHELRGLWFSNNLSVKEKTELFTAMFFPRFFVWLCRFYRKKIGRSLG